MNPVVPGGAHRGVERVEVAKQRVDTFDLDHPRVIDHWDQVDGNRGVGHGHLPFRVSQDHVKSRRARPGDVTQPTRAQGQ